MKLHFYFTLVLFLLLLPLGFGQNPALAEIPELAASKIYKQVDEQGNITFTDTPPIDNTQTIEEIQITEHGSITNATPGASQNLDNSLERLKQEIADKAAAEKAGQAAMQRRYTVTIDNPKAGQVFGNDTMEILVSTKVNPALSEGDRLQVLVNGLPVLPPQTENAFKLPFLPSGIHEIKVEVVTAEGIISTISAPVTVTQMRTQGGENTPVNLTPYGTQQPPQSPPSQSPPSQSPPRPVTGPEPVPAATPAPTATTTPATP